MSFHIIVKGGERERHKLGKTRSEQEENLRKEWGSTMTDEQLDKCKFLERKRKDHDGSTKNFIPGHHIDDYDGAVKKER